MLTVEKESRKLDREGLNGYTIILEENARKLLVVDFSVSEVGVLEHELR